MRERFNTGRYRERLHSGEFSAVVMDECKPRADVATEPLGTMSQMVSYRDKDDNEVACVHQYLRPDGTLGASGLPDPKKLFEEGVHYRLGSEE